jgi:hypothetical protein
MFLACMTPMLQTSLIAAALRPQNDGTVSPQSVFMRFFQLLEKTFREANKRTKDDDTHTRLCVSTVRDFQAGIWVKCENND